MIATKNNFHPRHDQPRSIYEPSKVRLTYGIHDFQAEIAGLSVEESQLAYTDILGVEDDAEVFANGRRAEKSVRLQAGDRLEFVKVRGRKGGDEEQRRIMLAVEKLASKMNEVESALKRMADHFDPPKRASVTSSYVAVRLGRTARWIGELARTGKIPESCICPRSGDGKYWRFWKDKIDDWIEKQ